MAELLIYNIRSSSASCIVTGMDTMYGQDDRTVRYLLNGTEYATLSIPAHTASGGAVIFTGLRPETVYAVCAVITYTGGGTYTVTLQTSFTTLSSRPSHFYWATEKVSGASFLLTAEEWNALCTNVNAVRAYKGLEAAALSVAVHGTPFTAAHFNEVRSAILQMIDSASIPVAVRGAPVTAAAINALADTVNSI